MSDAPSPDGRARAGTVADRSPLQATAGTSTLSGAVGLFAGTVDWWIKCYSAHQIVVPDNAMIILWGTALAPMFQLIYHIVMNKLQKAANE